MKIQDLSLKVKLGGIFTIAMILNFIGFLIILQFIDEYKNYSYFLDFAEQPLSVEQIMLEDNSGTFNGNLNSNYEQKIKTVKHIQISIMAINLMIFLFAMWASINHIIHPISEVIQLMKKVAEGDIKIKKLKIYRNDEVGHLAKSFNLMVSNLKHLVSTGEVQADFLPAEISNQSFEIKTIYKPSEYVSGDFFYYHWNEETKCLYGYLIDIMGHGLNTALHTSHLHVLFDQAGQKENLSLVEKVKWINTESMKYLTDGTFAAGICFVFDFHSNKLKYVSCGINHFLMKSKQKKRLVTVEGGLLGIIENMPYEQNEISFEAGDCFYFLTDGLLDHIDSVEERPGSSGFLDTIQALETLSTCDFIKDNVSALCINIK